VLRARGAARNAPGVLKHRVGDDDEGEPAGEREKDGVVVGAGSIASPTTHEPAACVVIIPAEKTAYADARDPSGSDASR